MIGPSFKVGLDFDLEIDISFEFAEQSAQSQTVETGGACIENNFPTITELCPIRKK